MEAIQVRSNSDSVIITIDRNIVNESEVIAFFKWLNIEKLAKEADFSNEILDLSKVINRNIWDKLKNDINFKNRIC
jgi:hypothetical protein